MLLFEIFAENGEHESKFTVKGDQLLVDDHGNLWVERLDENNDWEPRKVFVIAKGLWKVCGPLKDRTK